MLKTVICLFLLLLGLQTHTAEAAPAYDLRLVQLLHRHGARSPIVSYNETAICGTAFPCGYLNVPGQQMMVNIGSYLRTRYTADTTVVGSTPYLPYNFYNLSVSYTRSTDVLRTLQSAEGLLRGLFPDMTAYYPAVHTVENTMDALLHSSVVPVIMARYNYGDAENAAVVNAELARRGLTDEDLRGMAAEVHSSGYCAKNATRHKCALKLCDIALAYQSTGELVQYPLLRQNLESLCAATAVSSYNYFAYNESNPVHQMQGVLSQQLIDELLGNIQKHQATDGLAPPFKLYGYSAHDTTLSPFSASLGDNSLDAMLPPFATTYIIELLSKTAATGAVSWYLRVLRGHPGVTPESGYTFALDNFSLRCRDASGHVYVAADNVCPLADFQRFVEARRPTSEAGLCHIDPKLATRMDCPVDAEGDPRVLSADCRKYRQTCPAFVCGTGYRLDAVDYGCYRIKAQDSSSSSSSGVGAGLMIAMLLVGVALGFAGHFVFVRWQHRKKQAEDVTLVD